MGQKKLFISYSHADSALLAVLRTHLKPLERTGVIAPWFDGYLVPGDDIDAQVRRALETAELVALLVSPDFLASDYCYDVEMQSAVRRHEAGAARVVPIIARECQWHGAPFGRLVAVPSDGKPIMSAHWPDKDAAWTIVAKGIESAAKAEVVASRNEARATPAPAAAPLGGQAPMRVAAKKRFTDRDKDEFKGSAFDHIARMFEISIGVLDGELSGSFRRIDANKFTATIYKSGTKVAGCTLWMGGAFSSDSICYVGNDRGETNSMNNWLSIETNGDALALKPQMTLARGGDDVMLDPHGAAQFLWAEFVARLQ
ncbi:hypothetical protein U91I_01357 [alpha proteobacterium U9-1i]|nr:hypothetical protein U91I_01357 [alpha proteobacterium U9-1i]